MSRAIYHMAKILLFYDMANSEVHFFIKTSIYIL